MTDTVHPESYGHWGHSQISDLLHERDRLRADVTKYKARLQVVHDALHREGFEKELAEWYDFDGVPK